MFEEMVGWAVDGGADLIIGETFPTALDPLCANRYEIGAFAAEVHSLGINYLGVCCSGSPMLIRQVAEAVGRTTGASRFSERMQNHLTYGDSQRLPEHIVALGSSAQTPRQPAPSTTSGTRPCAGA